MNCFDFIGLLPSFVLNRLEPSISEKCEAHKAACPNCQNKFELEQKLHARLSLVKDPDVSKEYWDTYERRLDEKLENSKISQIGHVQSYLWTLMKAQYLVPAMASVLVVFLAFRMGHKSGAKFINVGARLVSEHGENDAQKAFREMSELFPKRINWISYADGAVDFSINSKAFGDESPLAPLTLEVLHRNETFPIYLLIRPGLDASVRAHWGADKEVVIRAQVSANSKDARIALRLSGAEGSGSLEGTAILGGEGSQVFGTFRWAEELVTVRIASSRFQRQIPAQNGDSHEKNQDHKL